MGMTIGRIMDYILKRHAEALLNPMVQKPYAWAIYQTWKWVNANEKPRKVADNDKTTDNRESKV